MEQFQSLTLISDEPRCAWLSQSHHKIHHSDRTMWDNRSASPQSLLDWNRMMLGFRLALFSLAPFTFFILVAPEVGAQTCGTSVCTESEICLAGDGLILLCENGQYFGGSFAFPGNAGLDNYGGFPAGTRVHVEGCAVPGMGICPIAWSIRDNTIRSLTPAVPALGHPGRVLAVLLVLGIGSFGIWRFRNQLP